ncbi:hypothetical protein [Hyphomonas sp.]|uniref:hypothetical protein n=1 Tax=Hyphomonas sp. TaxID=87 RepID=UPI001BCDEE8D|nr:hypothetical protein [Hyphomonas sp.]
MREALPGWATPAVSWSAVFAGGLAALSLSIVLAVLGSAFGFGAMSPFAGDGLSITAIGTVTVLWLILTQIFASVVGEYFAGRVRSRWSIHQDGVFFGDTVHGLLTWTVASTLMAAATDWPWAGTQPRRQRWTTAVIASVDGAPSPADLITDRLYRSPARILPSGPRWTSI